MKPLEFAVGEHVFLRFLPTKDVGRAIKSRKLTPKFIGPYQILKKSRTCSLWGCSASTVSQSTQCTSCVATEEVCPWPYPFPSSGWSASQREVKLWSPTDQNCRPVD